LLLDAEECDSPQGVHAMPSEAPAQTIDGAYIGISGWRYAPWRGDFYPDDLPQKDELAFAAARFNTIELNGSFYSLQLPRSYARWYSEAPAGFVFAIKGSRYITHMLRLRGVDTALANLFASGLFELREKLPVPLAAAADAAIRPRAPRGVLRAAASHGRASRGPRTPA
jgi:hypothetical protein